MSKRTLFIFFSVVILLVYGFSVHAAEIFVSGIGGDAQSPSITIFSPARNAVVSGRINVLVRATDNVAVHRVVYACNGVPMGASYAAGTFGFIGYDTLLCGGVNGPQAITARAYDRAGNASALAVTIVNIQNPPGEPDYVVPANREMNVSPQLSALDWTDAPRAESYDIYFGEALSAVPVATGPTKSKWFVPAAVLPLRPSTDYYWQVVARGSLLAGAMVGPEWVFTTAAQ